MYACMYMYVSLKLNSSVIESSYGCYICNTSKVAILLVFHNRIQTINSNFLNTLKKTSIF